MTDENKVYHSEVIQDAPFPTEGVADFGSSQDSNKDTYHPTEIPDTSFPEMKTATELLSASLNTKSRKILGEFKFTRYGAIQVGAYVSGVSGDIKISPSGIVARNLSGVTTFTLDGDTGDASFLGTINASTIIASEFQAGTLSSDNILTGQIDVGVATDGAYVRIDGANNRIIVHDGSYPRIVIGNI